MLLQFSNSSFIWFIKVWQECELLLRLLHQLITILNIDIRLVNKVAFYMQPGKNVTPYRPKAIANFKQLIHGTYQRLKEVFIYVYYF